MDREIIDQPIWDQVEVVKWLQEAGYSNVYPLKNGKTMVQQDVTAHQPYASKPN